METLVVGKNVNHLIKDHFKSNHMKTDNQMLIEQFNGNIITDVLLTFVFAIVCVFVIWIIAKTYKRIKYLMQDINGLHQKRNAEFADSLRRLQKTEK